LLAAAAGALLPYVANEGLKLAGPQPRSEANDRVR